MAIQTRNTRQKEAIREAFATAEPARCRMMRRCTWRRPKSTG